MKQPFYPAEWAIKIENERIKPAPIYGNADLLNANAAEYYRYRHMLEEFGYRNIKQVKVPAR